ncbi:hypothetical protein G9A89_013596 [Geosiphon pyriformis]|nr:hypothetical protein G9A89_013596 [Geosiphon pyriformis]
MLPEECNWIDVAMKGEVCDQTCQYALSISEKVRRGTPFNAAYNTMALINRATQKDVHQMKEAEYIEYTMELTGFDYEDEQINIQLCEECVMPCNNQWCLEYYALSIPLPDENNENEIEFGVSELVEELPTTPIYLLEKQSPLQLKYFDNHGQGIRPEKAHEIDAGYDLRYPGKDILVLQPKSSLASKGINIRRGVIDAEYTGDITIMLQNETDKPFKIEHAEKIAQAIYLPLINISDLQSVNNREQLGKSKRGTQGFGSIERFTVPPITISPFGEHHEIYTCSKPTTTQQIFESNEQIYENPQIVSNFIEIVRHTLLLNPNIIPTTENYHFLKEKLSRINMGPLEPQQQRQLKQLIAEFADIFAKDNNDLEIMDMVQHQIHIGDAPPKH